VKIVHFVSKQVKTYHYRTVGKIFSYVCPTMF